MSIETWPIMSKFKINDTDKALEAIKNTTFNYSYEGIEKAKNLEEIFECWHYILNHNDGIYSIASDSDIAGDEEELFNALAPFVEDEGVIETGMEFGEALGDIVRVYSFTNGKCELEYLYQDVDEETFKPTERRPFNEDEFY